MSPLVEMLTLLNRDWEFRFLMRLKRVVVSGAHCFFTEAGDAGRGWNV